MILVNLFKLLKGLIPLITLTLGMNVVQRLQKEDILLVQPLNKRYLYLEALLSSQLQILVKCMAQLPTSGLEFQVQLHQEAMQVL